MGAAAPPPSLADISSSEANCFSSHLQQIQSPQLFRSCDLPAHTDSISAMVFSDDGTLLI